MAEGNGNTEKPQKPRILPSAFTPVAGGKKSTSQPPTPRRGGGPTAEDIRLIAKDVARQEIVATSNALAKKVHEVIARHIGPVNQKFVEIYNEVNKLIILVNTMHDHLEKYGVIKTEEFNAMLKKSADEAKEAYKAAKDAAGKATVEVGEPSLQEGDSDGETSAGP